jgi:hypothetical protein
MWVRRQRGSLRLGAGEALCHTLGRCMAAEVNEGDTWQVARFDYVDRPGPHNLRVYLRSLDHIKVGAG